MKIMVMIYCAIWTISDIFSDEGPSQANTQAYFPPQTYDSIPSSSDSFLQSRAVVAVI